MSKYKKFSYDDYQDVKYEDENDALKWIIEKINELTNISINDIVKIIEEYFKEFSDQSDPSKYVFPETLYKSVSEILTSLLKKGLINIEMCNKITEETNKILKKYDITE